MKYPNMTQGQVEKLAQQLYKKTGPEYRIFGLIGQLGAGKTTFTKALAKSAGTKQAKSPTFVVMHCYPGSKFTLYHIDLYRLTRLKELSSLGFEEVFENPNNLVVIEWVDKFPSLYKQCHALITLKVAKDNKRNVTIQNL